MSADTALACCASPRPSPLWGGLLARCAHCGLVSTARAPAFVYADDYFVDGGQGYDFDSALARALDAGRFDTELDGLEARGLRGGVLDVGCAVGTFLLHARRRGWEIAGVEVAEFARRRAEERLGAPIASSLDELPAGRTWDVVTLHHVLEHVHHPVEFLAHGVRPRVGRHLLVEVPNFASLAARAEGTRWRDLRPEQHVLHFEPATLRRTVESAGFEVLSLRTLSEPLWSLRAAMRTLRLLRGLGPERRFGPEDVPTCGGGETPRWTPPRGARAALVGASRAAFAPLLRWIERTERGERLVIEARPAGTA